MSQNRRPDAEHRWHCGRTEPAAIAVRTQWLYSDYDERTKLPPGRTRWPFSRSATVVDFGEFEPRDDSRRDLHSALHDMIEVFGDDADLEIIVRRRTT